MRYDDYFNRNQLRLPHVVKKTRNEMKRKRDMLHKSTPLDLPISAEASYIITMHISVSV